AVGTDGGGSVRIPAGYCNLVGLFPSIGRVPQRGTSSGRAQNSQREFARLRKIAKRSEQNGLDFASQFFDSFRFRIFFGLRIRTCSAAGPMAHTPQDCARLYAVMAGTDYQVGSEQSRIQPEVTIPKTLLKSLVGLKVGIDQSWNQAGVPDALFNPFQKRLNWMIDQGAEIVHFIMPEKDVVYAAHLMCFSNEIASDVIRYQQQGKQVDYDVEMISNIQAQTVRATDYFIANKIRTKFMRIMDDLFSKMDIIATPMSKSTMVEIGAGDHLYGRSDANTVGKISYFTRIFNFVGCPGIMVQLGHDKNDVPFGFHMAAKWWNEEKLFEIAAFMESEAPYKKPVHLHTPPFKTA
ncbi:unnamed protein product, partial [Oikopleura dioica]